MRTIRRRTLRSGTVTLLAVTALLSTVLSGTGSAASPPADTPPAVSPSQPATPAAAAAEARRDLAGDITFSEPSGTFRDEVTVELGTTVDGAEIHYTTDGQLPTADSPVYDGTPLRLTDTTQLRAQAFVDGTATGDPGTALYIANTVDTSHDLPILVMDAYGAGKPGRDWADVATLLMEPSEDGTTSPADTPTVASRAGFHLRGQSSSSFEKAPYRLELRDNEDEDLDVPLLGMPADADWVLRGPFPDKTLIRDAFAYTLGRDLGVKTPRHAFVEVYLNLDGGPLSEEDYQGVYLLDETIKRSPDRVDITKLKKSDIAEPEVTGGYIFKFEGFAAEEPTLPCTGDSDTCWRDLEVAEPDGDDLQPEQQEWLTQYVQGFHDALHSDDPANPETGYPAYIDVDSFVNFIIVNELSREGDAYIRSTYFHKDRGGPIVAGPLWDYDLGFGAIPGSDSTEGFQFEPIFGPGPFTINDWFLQLMRVPEFSQQVAARWQELRNGILSDEQLTKRVDTLAAPLTNAAERNFAKWQILNEQRVGPFFTITTDTWEEQLDLMKDWLLKRAAWLDQSGWQPRQ